jgi:ribonuclease HII
MGQSSSLFDHDRQLAVRWVAGADEAGRGCLAGPLVAAAVLLDLEALGNSLPAALGGLTDSKKLSSRQRQRLYGPVLRHAARVCVISRSAQSIDAHGIQHANLGGLADALRAVSGHLDGDVVRLSDGFALPSLECAHQALVGGDRTSAAIAAASIIAKETRDRFMARADTLWPGYGFAGHAGYPTPAHKQALNNLGPSPIHRLSFGSLRAGSA